MNILSLTLKQMRQRFLSGWLTWFSVTLGVGLAIAILLCRREGQTLFGQSEYGFDLLIGAKGSPTQLVLNTVYHLDQSPGNLPYSLYETMASRRDVKLAVPYAVGDSYRGRRIVATLPKLFGRAEDGGAALGEGIEVRPGAPYSFAAGRCFHARRFEAVIGSELAEKHLLAIGSTFKATHGVPKEGETPDIHEEDWTVVGILNPTHTANDRVVFIPLVSFYAISEHEQGMERIFQEQGNATGPAPAKEPEKPEEKHYVLNGDGTIDLRLPKEEWLLSAVLVKARGPAAAFALRFQINNGKDAMAVLPAVVMQEFFSTFLEGSMQILLVISLLVTVVANIGVLVSIYNSVVYRQREIAIFRALGATRRRVLAIICLEAAFIGLLGGLAGWVLGHLLGAAGSVYLQRLLGQGINWLAVGREEGYYVAAAVGLALLAGLVPALKAYRTPVADNLTA